MTYDEWAEENLNFTVSLAFPDQGKILLDKYRKCWQDAQDALRSPVAPTQPPDHCPACGAVAYKDKEFCSTGITYRRFECGSSFMERDNWIGQCAFFATSQLRAAAIALRAERDALGQDIAKLAQQRNAAFSEMHAIRSAIRANPKEATSDEVARVVAERDAALARAEKAEGERKDFLAERKRREELLHGMNKVGGQREAYWSMRVIELEHDLTDADADLTAARARLAELQAVCDAAVKWRANVERHSNPNWISVADLIQAVDEYSAALASGAVVEGEVTK